MTWTVLLLAAATMGPPAVEVQPIAGQAVAGTLASLDAEGATVETAKGPVKLELDRLMSLAVQEPQGGGRGQPTVWLELVDGSTPTGTVFTVAEGRARLTLPSGASLEIPRGDIRWVRFQPHSAAIAAQWAKVLQDPTKSDLLVVKKGDSVDYHRGVIRGVSGETVQFDLEGESLPVKRAKVHGLVFHQTPGRALPETLCTIRESGGPAWAAQSVSLLRDEIQWTTPTGLKLSRPLSTLSRIDFSGGKVTYLSDLEPESIDWAPYFAVGPGLAARAELFAPRKDRSLMSGPLELEGKRFAKGLAIHSRTALVYRLPERFRRFTAVGGIDDRVRPRGHVQLAIRGDDRELLQWTVAGSDPARPIDLDVSGVRRLSILVDFGDDLDVGDHLVLGEAKLLK